MQTDQLFNEVMDLRDQSAQDFNAHGERLENIDHAVRRLSNRFGTDEILTLGRFLGGGMVLLFVLQVVIVLSQFAAVRNRGAAQDFGPLYEQIRQLEEKMTASPAARRGGEGGKPDGAPDRLRQAAESLSATADEVGVSLSRFLEDILDAGKTLRSRSEPILAQLDERARELETRAEQTRASEKALREEAERIEGERATLEARLGAEDEAASRIDILLPESLRAGGGLAHAQCSILAALADNSVEARRFLRSLAEWEELTVGISEDERADAPAQISALGARGHAFINKHLPPDADAHLEIGQALLKYVREGVARLCPHIEIKPVFPGDRFDSDRMECVASGSGNRLTVQQPLSWLILDRSGDQARILYRARVLAD